VVEVGTGAGTLTRVLAGVVAGGTREPGKGADAGGRVITYEVDKRLEPILQKQFAGFGNIELRFEDALRADMDFQNFTVVANIPYYITTPLLMKFMANKGCTKICVLVQDDVARRIVARPGGKDYGALSVALQTRADCRIVRAVPRGAFVPVPGVDSAFVVLQKKPVNQGESQIDLEVFERFLKSLFSARRKTIVNGLVLCGLDKENAIEVLNKLGIKENTRAEQISPAQFVEMAGLVSAKNTKK